MNCYGRLTVIYEDGPAHVMALCSCGSGPKRYLKRALKSGNTQSCGCLARERQAQVGRNSATHRRTGTPEHRVWLEMRARCGNPEHKDFPRYGGRGIRVCERWQNDFVAFLDDMGERPSALHSIDRIDNEKGYGPENCRWATRTEQTRNRRIAVNIEFRGQTKPLAVWCEELGINYYTAHRRIRRAGWTPERAFGGAL